MELRDLVVTPLLLIIVGVGAVIVRPLFTDEVNRRYFLPALWCKIIGALALGFLYQYYYSGGDTYAYHTHGSRVIWDAIMESPMDGLRLLYSNGEYGPGLWEDADKIWYWRDPKSFFVIRVSLLFDLFTFSTYSATAVLFALVSFIGCWMLYSTFYKLYPVMHKWAAVSCLFVPSIIFWGSGILKDTLTLAFLGAITFCFYNLFIAKKFSVGYLLLFVVSFWVIFSIKKYIVISFIAAVFVWFFSANVASIKSTGVRILSIPLAIIFCLGLGYVAINRVVEDDPKYALNRIAETARVTAYDIRYWTGKDAGSGYSLGELDGSFLSMIKLAPLAINVTLFRPYIWEVRNPLMLLNALEAIVTLVLTVYVLFKSYGRLISYLKHPPVVFCLVFSVIFAFGVGVSTYNFGTLARYKIPLLPFYFLLLGMLYYLEKSDRKLRVLDRTE